VEGPEGPAPRLEAPVTTVVPLSHVFLGNGATVCGLALPMATGQVTGQACPACVAGLASLHDVTLLDRAHQAAAA
jgi:hypothetical protein